MTNITITAAEMQAAVDAFDEIDHCISLHHGHSPRSVTVHSHPSPTIPCLFTACPCNLHEKCEMPSAIQIGADGVCVQARLKQP
jgi:hypothetical protein